MVVALTVAVMTEMGDFTLRMLHRVAHAHDRRISGVQGDQYGEQEGQEESHGADYIRCAERQ